MKSMFMNYLSRKGLGKQVLCVGLACTMTLLGTANLFANDPASAAAEIQQRVLTGVVKDASGETLPGVNVIVKGTTTGVTTDLDGKYSVRIPNAQAVLQFSFVGYTTQELPAGSQATLDITLQESVVRMEEVVVTALGMKRQTKALAYSSAEVKGDDLGKTNDVNLMNSLQGKIAGVSIDVMGTGAGGSSKVTIRGNTSINRDSNPLYVVDGVPISRSQMGGSRDFGDALTLLNPSDIETMSVLKGAAATALYGSRASNGVILITTKSGANQRGIGVSYSGSFGIENYTNPYEGRQTEYGPAGMNGDNSDIYPTVWNQETHRAWGRRYDGKDLGIFFNDNQNIPLKYQYLGTHWDNFMETGYTMNNSLSFSGGSDKQRFRFSVSDMRYGSPIPNSDMNRQTVNLSTNSKFGNRISMDARISYSTSQTQNRPNTSRYIQMISMIPTMWEIDWLKGNTAKWGAKEDGWMLPYSTNDYYPNPYWSAYQDATSDKRDRISAFANLRYDITDWLFIAGRMGIESNIMKASVIDAYGWLRDGAQVNGTGNVQEHQTMDNQTNMDFSLVFNKAYGDFNVSAMAGGSTTRSEYTRDGVRGNQLLIPFYHVVTNASQLYTIVSDSKSGINSLYGSAEVSYKDFLYLTATGRNDWFSTLSPDNNSIFYPSIGLSYIFSNNLDLPDWMSFGKLRASYAKVGGGASAYMTKFAYNLDATGYLSTPTLSVPGTIPNANLRPYQTREYEVGADLRFLENRIGIDYAYYDKETTDDIVGVTLPQSSGFTSATVNLGAISNKGHEIMLTLVPYSGNFRWEMNLAYSHNVSKILDLGGVSEVNMTSNGMGGGVDVKQVVGEKANAIYGYTQQYTEDGQPMWERWTFSYGGQTHQSWRPVRGSSKELLGYGVHPNAGSFTTTFSYKGVTLSAMIDAKWGAKVAYVGEQEMIERGQSIQTLTGRDGGLFLEGVYKDGSGNWVDVSNANGYTILADPAQNRPNDIVVAGNEIPYNVKHFENFYRTGFVQRVADMVVMDASYVKFRQLMIGYTLPQSALKGLPVQNVRVSLVGRNLFDIYNDLPNGDPSTISNNAFGINNYALPALRSFTLNLDINF